MPRHPPNAQNNKQQDTRTKQETLCRRKQTVRCSRPLYSSQPTHPHPHPTTHTRQQNTGQATRAHYPRTPTACHPHTRARAPTTTHQAAAGVSPTPHTRQPTTPAPPHRQETRAPAGRPALPREQAPSRPRPINSPSKPKQPGSHPHTTFLRKEVIQPHLPVRLPCYDFVPITSPTFDRSP